MATSGKARKREYKKAERIARAVREGKQVAPDDLTWYRDTYLPSRKPFPGAPKAEETANASGVGAEGAPGGPDDGPDDDETPEPAITEGPGDLGPNESGAREPDPTVPPPAGEPPPPPAPPAPPPPRGPRFAPPKPPRTKVDDDDAPKGAKKEKWQDKYKSKQEGREKTVVTCANAICSVLHAMENEMRAVGVEPIVSVETLYGAWVLTLDDFLPANLELKPEHVALGGSSALLVQRFMNRKKIAGVKEAKSAEEVTRERMRAQAEQRRKAQEENDGKRVDFDPHLSNAGNPSDAPVDQAGPTARDAEPAPVVAEDTGPRAAEVRIPDPVGATRPLTPQEWVARTAELKRQNPDLVI